MDWFIAKLLGQPRIEVFELALLAASCRRVFAILYKITHFLAAQPLGSHLHIIQSLKSVRADVQIARWSASHTQPYRTASIFLLESRRNCRAFTRLNTKHCALHHSGPCVLEFVPFTRPFRSICNVDEASLDASFSIPRHAARRRLELDIVIAIRKYLSASDHHSDSAFAQRDDFSMI